MDFIVNNKELIEANKEMEKTLGNTKQMGKEAKRMSNYYSEGYGRWRHEQKLLTAETRAMMYEMKYGWMNNSAAYAQAYNDQIRARYGMYQLAKAGKDYEGTNRQMMNSIYGLGLALKKARDEMMKNDVRLRASFIEQAGMMANMTTQAQRISENYKRMKNPIYMLNLGYLTLAKGLNKVANNGNAANLALRMLGKDANTKQLNDMVMMINQGIMRTGWIALGAAVSVYYFYGTLHKLSMENKAYESSFNTMISAILRAIKPMLSVFQTIAMTIFKFVTNLANLISKFNEAHPTLAKFIQGIVLLTPLLTLLLSPLAIGIGLLGGFQAALFAAWAFIGPVVTGLSAMAATVSFVAAALVGLPLLFNHLMNTNKTFHDTTIRLWTNLKNKANEVFNFIGPVATKAIDMLANAFAKIGESVKLLLSGDFSQLGAFFKAMLPTIIGVAVGGIPGLLISLGTRFIPSLAQGMQSGSGSIVTTINNIFASITSFIQTQLPTMLAMGLGIVRNLVLGIIQALPSLMQGFITLFQSLIPMIATLLPVLAQVGLQIVMALAQGILQAITALVPVLLQFVQQIITVISQLAPLLISTGMQLVMQLINGIVVALPSLISTSVTMITTLIQGLASMLPSLITQGIQIVTTLISGIASMLPLIVSTAADIVAKLAVAIITNLPAILSAGVKILMALVRGILSVIGALMNAAHTIGTQLISAFRSIDLTAVGSNIMKGLLNGITSMGGAVLSKAKEIASSVISTVKGALNIHSPSREMFALGEFTGAGFRNGIDATAQSVYKASVNLATQPMNAVEAPSVTSTVGNTSNNSATYTFAPQITVQGGGDGGNITADIHSALEVSYNDMFKQLGLGTGGLG